MMSICLNVVKINEEKPIKIDNIIYGVIFGEADIEKPKENL